MLYIELWRSLSCAEVSSCLKSRYPSNVSARRVSRYTVTDVTLLIIMAINNKSKRRLENLGRRKKTVIKKIYELGKYDGIDVALIIRQNG
jgi:SRF-type transcription factor (DNA-binding and dimerisation domain)